MAKIGINIFFNRVRPPEFMRPPKAADGVNNNAIGN